MVVLRFYAMRCPNWDFPERLEIIWISQMRDIRSYVYLF